MRSLRRQTFADRGVDLANLNAIVDMISRGDLVAVAPGLNKEVVNGQILLSLAYTRPVPLTPFEVVKTSRTKVKVSKGRVYMNGKEFEFEESEEVTISATCNVAMQWLVEGDEATILASQEILLPTTVPTWSATKRFRILAKVVFENGGITRIEDRRMDIHMDEVVPRSELDYRVPIRDATGWSGTNVPNAKGYVANTVRMTEGDGG